MGGADAVRQVIGVDIGGTGIKGLGVREDGRVLAEAARATDARLGREAILAKLRELIDELIVQLPEAQAIGIASAGRVNAETGEVVYATDNLPGWQGMPLTAWAASQFGLPAAAENDANAALLGEVWLGAGRGKDELVMLTLGTGVGGAHMTAGRLVRGARWSGGDWGHSVLVPGGRLCNCGKRGCVEQYISGTALVRLGHELTGRAYGHGRELMAEADKGEAAAVEVLERYTSAVALVADNIAVAVDPELIIIGGGVIHDQATWWPLLLNKLGAAAVVAAELGNRAGCFGVAKLVLDRLSENRIR
ncbi:ROK family protein [Paenibacillus albidus]|nr:ROK family protein [Paenibacillus albidus]